MGRGCLGCLGSLVLVAGVAALAFWVLNDDIARFLERRDAPAGETADAVAEEANAKMERLLVGGETVRLSQAEFASLLQTRFAGWIPAGIEEPSVGLEGDTLHLAGAFPTESLPQQDLLDEVRSLLPDTARIEIGGNLRLMEPGRAAFHVLRMRVARIPVPEQLHPVLLRQMGGGSGSGLPDDAFPILLPEGVREARVEEGYLILTP